MNSVSTLNLHKLSFRQGHKPSSSNVALNLVAVVLVATLAVLFAGLLACGFVFVLPLALVPVYAAAALTSLARARLSLAR